MTGRILLADDIPTHRIYLKAQLDSAAYDVALARDPRDLQRSLTSERPDILLLSDDFANEDALARIQTIRGGGTGASLPILLLADRADRDFRIDAVKVGADTVLEKRPDVSLLRAYLRNLTRRSARDAELQNPQAANDDALGFAEPMAPLIEPRRRVAVVAQNLAEGLAWRNSLTRRIRDRVAVLDPATALRDLAAQPAPDALVISELAHDPDQAIRLVSDLRSRSETLNSAIILVQNDADAQRTIAALDLGVSDIVPDGFDAEEMTHLLRRALARKAHNDRRRAALQDGVRLANTDPLTGLYNRRSALVHLNRVMSEAEAADQTYAVMVLDLDRFKSVNDSYGHAAGDHVLQQAALRLKSCLRAGDFMARIGGEEFLAVIRNCDQEAAETTGERLRQQLANAPILLPDGLARVDITVSIGIVVGGPGAATGTAPELIDLADRGLYSAKSDGRNQVTVYQSAA
ncbi:MAG: diguanylate cyclase [Pseudomonadota bacterium]